ncbi:XP_029636947.2uncharacterized protein LOC115212249 [Octopus vulgaris]|uniref:XP_029636947.2uncharacterized protein LOC115212249 n=1 Tax=Octopus vulgaris TaxID=6645 RepID=A0AA36BYV7_OCTVU|nr:XP_029636947.2uncharacterized protein LOC115212249 [Octopus vulgaris]
MKYFYIAAVSSIYPPDITAPENVTLFENQASIIDCNAKGNPTPEVWLEDENRTFLSNSILTFNRKNISRVSCTAIAKSERNGNLTARKEINILLKLKAMFSSGSNGPKKRNVSNGETVIFKQCFYSHPKSDVKWQKNEESIDSNKYLITDYLQDEFPFKGSCTSLKIEDIKDDAIGTYTLTVENSIGKETVVFTLRYKNLFRKARNPYGNNYWLHCRNCVKRNKE